jgi:hypothetical protein
MPLKVFFAIQDLNYSSDLLMLDYGIFYEFIPMDTGHRSKKIRLADVELFKIMLCDHNQFWFVALFD